MAFTPFTPKAIVPHCDGCVAGRLQGVDTEGRRQPVREMKDGEVHFRAVDGEAVHDAVNVGSGPWRNIVVELLDPPLPG